MEASQMGFHTSKHFKPKMKTDTDANIVDLIENEPSYQA